MVRMARHAMVFALIVPATVSNRSAASPTNALRLTTGTAERDAASGNLRVSSTVSWKNGWRNARNHDAVWLFAKIRASTSPYWRHARIVSITPATGGTPLTCTASLDRVGAFCAPSSTFRGDVSASIAVTLDASGLAANERTAPSVEAKVFGIEMVYVPAGAFSIGDPDPRSVEFAAFYKSDASGGHAGTYRITSEAPIRVAPEAGALYYRANLPEYEGDRQGPVPAEFPKGTRAFYSMKYEILQGQYADFLNNIRDDMTFFRAIHGGVGYYDERGTIRLERGDYIADRPERPANWVSWDDGLAFADWAGLRPMTEFEFTKAARGPVEPGRAEFPWGTSSRERLLRRISNDDIAQTGTADESGLTDSTRDVLGASYYWVMDLAGSVWERVVSPGHPRGRAFRGTHGDGNLASYGVATNNDWPVGDHEVGGYGYRGGGFYERERERGRPDGEFNPFSPVEWRRYGSWGGAPRSVAYGFRAVRTADQ